jgi:CheY-like chemotaxis protein/DNA-binding CsgD family transcriptional regulator
VNPPEDPSALPPPRPATLAAVEAKVVLIVDDVPDNLSLLHDALDDAGHAVLVATDGPGALARARQAQPDIVLLDAMMPGMDGFEVARRLKADPATAAIPIVFMTAYTETDRVVQAYAAGGVDYVTKPIQPREVLARIAAHARHARAQAQAHLALDAFGHATAVLRPRDGRLVWQTALARELLAEFLGPHGDQAPAELCDWARRETAHGQPGQSLVLQRGPRRLTLQLHALPDAAVGEPAAAGGATPTGEWLVVATATDDAAQLEALAQAWRLTAREAEVLLWVARGKTNRDIADILGMSPRTVTKHMEHIFEKLGVETRTAAAGMALGIGARAAARPR